MAELRAPEYGADDLKCLCGWKKYLRNPEPKLPELSRSSAGTSRSLTQVLTVFSVTSCEVRICFSALMPSAVRQRAYQD